MGNREESNCKQHRPQGHSWTVETVPFNLGSDLNCLPQEFDQGHDCNLKCSIYAEVTKQRGLKADRSLWQPLSWHFCSFSPLACLEEENSSGPGGLGREETDRGLGLEQMDRDRAQAGEHQWNSMKQFQATVHIACNPTSQSVAHAMILILRSDESFSAVATKGLILWWFKIKAQICTQNPRGKALEHFCKLSIITSM